MSPARISHTLTSRHDEQACRRVALDVCFPIWRAAAGPLAGILGFQTRPRVSIDYAHDTRSAVVDGQSTMASDHTLLKVYAWNDNEVGYTCRMVDLANIVIRISFVALRPLR